VRSATASVTTEARRARAAPRATPARKPAGSSTPYRRSARDRASQGGGEPTCRRLAARCALGTTDS
jgi:hypothetical protein